jgi:hypothetical protein
MKIILFALMLFVAGNVVAVDANTAAEKEKITAEEAARLQAEKEGRDKEATQFFKDLAERHGGKGSREEQLNRAMSSGYPTD